MYFVILWKHKEISIEELRILKPLNLKVYKDVAYFETKNFDYISKLWWVIKYWEIISIDDIGKYLDWVQLIWVNEDNLWVLIKRKYWIKRYKHIKTMWTDIDIKESGKEFILIWEELNKDSLIWVVTWYQDISLFETIDFEKPSRSMNVGMMPAKLTSMLVNIWLSQLDKNDDITIYDPFVGLGTTWFVVNYLSYNFIWSDLNITPCKQNFTWWEKTKYFKPWLKNSLFKHDVKQSFEKNFLKSVDLIVSEWWLGPVMKWFVSEKTKQYNINQIYEVYKAFFENVKNFWSQITVVITVPYYIWEDEILSRKIIELVEKLWFQWWFIKQVYKRPEQKIWRQILVISLN